MKLLIVDDSNFSQRVIASLLKKNLGDAEIYYARDGQEGFAKYKEVCPDYIFIDLLMPNINGEGLIKLIKQYDDKAKIFVISADVQKGIKEDIERYNILSFINKPFNEEKAQLVCKIIGNENNG